jgi:hypothetical protein
MVNRKKAAAVTVHKCPLIIGRKKGLSTLLGFKRSLRITISSLRDVLFIIIFNRKNEETLSLLFSLLQHHHHDLKANMQFYYEAL